MPIETIHTVDTGATGIEDNPAIVAAQDLPATVPHDGPAIEDPAAAGDWGLFQRRCSYIDANKDIDLPTVLALKRRFGLAYLGSRAQARGGVYLRTRPSVFTPAFIERMSAENTARRFKRYAWLERLMQLQQQLDQDQYRMPEVSGVGSATALRRHLHVVPAPHPA